MHQEAKKKSVNRRIWSSLIFPVFCMSSDCLLLGLSFLCGFEASPSNNVAAVLLLCCLSSSRVKAGPTALESALLTLEKMTSRGELVITLASLWRLFSEWNLRAVIRPACTLSYGCCHGSEEMVSVCIGGMLLCIMAPNKDFLLRWHKAPLLK